MNNPYFSIYFYLPIVQFKNYSYLCTQKMIGTQMSTYLQTIKNNYDYEKEI